MRKIAFFAFLVLPFASVALACTPSPHQPPFKQYRVIENRLVFGLNTPVAIGTQYDINLARVTMRSEDQFSELSKLPEDFNLAQFRRVLVPSKNANRQNSGIQLSSGDVIAAEQLRYFLKPISAYYTDGNYVIYDGLVIPEADPSSIRLLSESAAYVQDNNNLFFKGKLIGHSRDIEVFQPVPASLSADTPAVYRMCGSYDYGNIVVRNTDHVFFGGQVVPVKDITSFALISVDSTTLTYKDQDTVQQFSTKYYPEK